MVVRRPGARERGTGICAGCSSGARSWKGAPSVIVFDLERLESLRRAARRPSSGLGRSRPLDGQPAVTEDGRLFRTARS